MDDFEKSMRGYLLKVSEKLVKDVSGMALMLLKEHIYSDAYQKDNKVYLPSRNANPSYEFVNAFQLNEIRPTLDGFVRDIIYNWKGMHHWSENYYYTDNDGNLKEGVVHAHESFSGRDLREAMFNILRKRNDLSQIFDIDNNVDDFWKNFLNDFKKNISNWIKISLRAQGITDVHVEIDTSGLGGDN